MFGISRWLTSRLAVSIAAATLAAGIAAGVASAHARYESSNPSSGSTVSSLPNALEVTFTEELASIRIDVTGPDGASATTGSATIDLSARKHTSVPLRDAGAGTYTVVWHNVSGDDGDPNDGAFDFTVAGAAPAATAPVAGAQASTTPVAAAASATPAPAAAATGDDAITPGIHDVRVNTYRKRQAIRDQYRGKIKEVAFNEAVADDQGLESALRTAMGAGG